MLKATSRAGQFMTRTGMYADRISRRGFLPERLPLSFEQTNTLAEQRRVAIENHDKAEEALRQVNAEIRHAKSRGQGKRVAELEGRREWLKAESLRAAQECRNIKNAIKEIAGENAGRAFMAAAMRVLPREAIEAVWDEVHRAKATEYGAFAPDNPAE